MKCFGYALQGIRAALRSQRNMRIHLCVTFYVLIAGFVTRLDTASWAAVLLCIGAVLGAELFNTAIESMCDAVTMEYSKKIKKAKDCAAGAVLVLAVAAAAVGCVVFFSNGRPATAVAFASEHALVAGIIVLTLPVWLYYIFARRAHK